MSFTHRTSPPSQLNGQAAPSRRGASCALRPAPPRHLSTWGALPHRACVRLRLPSGPRDSSSRTPPRTCLPGRSGPRRRVRVAAQGGAEEGGEPRAAGAAPTEGSTPTTPRPALPGDSSTMAPPAAAAGTPPAGTPGAAASSTLTTPLLFQPGTSLALHVALAGLVALTFFNRCLFGYHPTLMALSFLLLMPEAVLAAVRSKGKERKVGLYRHMLLNAAAGVAGLLGLAAIFVNKERNGKPHLATIHAIAGAVAFGLSSLIATGGIPLLLGFPAALKRSHVPKTVSKMHKLVGTLTLLLGSLVCVLGLQTFKPAHPLHKGALTYGLAAMIVMSSALVILSISRKQQKPKPV